MAQPGRQFRFISIRAKCFCHTLVSGTGPVKIPCWLSSAHFECTGSLYHESGAERLIPNDASTWRYVISGASDESDLGFWHSEHDEPQLEKRVSLCNARKVNKTTQVS